MNSRSNRFFPIFLVSLMMIVPISILAVGEDPGSGPGTRDQSGFIAKDDFFIQPVYETDDMWIVVWIENSERMERKVPGSDNHFMFREIANSFAFPIDGFTYNSGTERRVLVDLFTAASCVYCPGAEGALDRLVDDRFPRDFTLIEWFGDGDYKTTSGLGRKGGYNVTGTPSVVFDGMTAQIGGDTNPNNNQIMEDYGKKIDQAGSEHALVTFSGSASISGDYIDYNVTFDVINPMPRGQWRIYAQVVEDVQSDHNGATVRHVARGNLNSKILDTLQEGFPDISIDEDATFDGVNRQMVQGDLDIQWDASDVEDGTDLDIDVLYRQVGGTWETLVSGLPNTGSYVWDTMSPRVDDGIYQIRLVATDSDDNSILSGKFLQFTLNNPDLPWGNVTFPQAGASLKGAVTITWQSDDDEDGPSGLSAKVSISNDTGSTWRVISYYQLTGDDWIPNVGEMNFNTLNYEDVPTYLIKVELRDRDDMITEVLSDQFEIYNNDRPTVTIISPSIDEEISGTLDIEWKVLDEEDMPSAIWGNISFRKGEGDWNILFDGLLDDEMEMKSFSTDDLAGDGDYTLMFTATDSRGLYHTASSTFTVYDPDAPEITSITGPIDVSDIRNDLITIRWEAEDPDADESLMFSLFITPSSEDNWTEVASELTTNQFNVPLTGLKEGHYRIKVVATDSSPQALTDEVFFGPIFYNAPDAPEVYSVSHPEGLTGQLPEDVNDTLEAGEYFLEILWNSRDPDGDNVTYSIYYSEGAEGEWTLLKQGLTEGSFNWNLTGLDTGEFRVRITAVDSSEKTLGSDMILGPFSWKNVFKDNVDQTDDDDSDDTDDMDDDSDEEPNWMLFVIIGVICVIVIIIVVLISLFLASKVGGGKGDTEVIPSQDKMDYNSIPEFDRTAPVVQPNFQPQVAATIPKQYSPEAVNWEEAGQQEQFQEAPSEAGEAQSEVEPVEASNPVPEQESDTTMTENPANEPGAAQPEQGIPVPPSPPV